MKQLSKNVFVTPDSPEVRLPVQACPGCGAGLDSATQLAGDVERAEPSPGALTICLYCAEYFIMHDDLKWHVPTLSELTALPDDVQLFLATLREQLMKHRKIMPHQLGDRKIEQ